MSDQPRTPQNTFELPYDEEMEKLVIGSVLVNPSVYLTLAAFLRPEDFFLLRHQYVWGAFQRITERADTLERQTLRRELQDHDQFDTIGGDLYISELMASAPSTFYAEQYARLVERDAVRRRLLEAGNDIQNIARDKTLAMEEAINHAEARLFKISEQRSQRDVVSMREATSVYFERIEHMMQQSDRGLGLPSGFQKLDALLGGLQNSDLIVFAGRPGMGKTSFMLSLAMNAAFRFDARILVFSLEMGVEQLVQRLVAMETGINMQKLRTGQFEGNEQRRLVEALGRLSTQNIFLDDSPALNPLQMRTKCQRVNYEYGLDLIILDYLQLMHAPGYEGNRVQEISYISRQMKELAREINVPLLSAAQLSRAVEQRADKRPQLSDLRESGSIEQDSDIVMFLYRDIVYNEATENPNQADVIVAKHRNGPTDTIPLYFDASSTRFRDGTRQNIDLSAL
jgi:replicative DNA helicase